MFRDMKKSSEAQLDAAEAASVEYFRWAVPAGRYRGWLVETAAGEIVSGGGVAIVDWPGSPFDAKPLRAWILNIYTVPEHRRRGLARLVMETIIAWCRQEGFAIVSLHASEDGRALYEALNFKPTNEMRLNLFE